MKAMDVLCRGALVYLVIQECGHLITFLIETGVILL